jgi:hypothetical protein
MALNELGHIDSAIVCGILKEKPAKLPSEISAVWIEDGVLMVDATLSCTVELTTNT